MTGYSGTPVWKKLCYKNGMPAYIDGGPSDYLSLVRLPVDITVTSLDHAKSDIESVHVFATSAAKLESKLRFYRQRIAPSGVIWVSWPKEFRSEDRRYRERNS